MTGKQKKLKQQLEPSIAERDDANAQEVQHQEYKHDWQSPISKMLIEKLFPSCAICLKTKTVNCNTPKSWVKFTDLWIE